MKQLVRILLVLIISFFMMQCGDSNSTGATNKYLGELPGIADASKVKLDELEEEKDNAADFDDALELQKEYDAADEQAETAFKEEVKKLNLPVSLPFEGEIDTDLYTVKDVKVTGAVYNQIILSATVVSKVTRKPMFAYLRMLDADGNILGGEKDWGVLAVSNFRNTKEGEEINLTGIFRGVQNLEDLEKVSFKTRDEWTNKH